jgi:hypothetical protein
MNELRSALRELKAAYGGEAGTPTDWRPRPARQPDLRVETEPADANHKGVVGSYVSTNTFGFSTKKKRARTRKKTTPSTSMNLTSQRMEMH